MENKWSTKLRDAILSNSAIRDGLHDDEAQPLIDWGMALSDMIGTKLSQMPESEVEVVYDTYQTALSKLMTRLNWLTIFSKKKGEDWTRKTIGQINELTQTLFGEQAPQLSPDEILQALLVDTETENKVRIAQLMRKVTPPNKDDLV